MSIVCPFRVIVCTVNTKFLQNIFDVKLCLFTLRKGLTPFIYLIAGWATHGSTVDDLDLSLQGHTKDCPGIRRVPLGGGDTVTEKEHPLSDHKGK